MRLDGKVCVVTGGARGIGKGVVETFIREGAKRVWALDVNEADLSALEKGSSVTGVAVDVTSSAAVNAVVGRIKSESGSVDVLVNNAGITRDAMIHKMTDADWDAVINVNLKGVFFMIASRCPLVYDPRPWQVGQQVYARREGYSPRSPRPGTKPGCTSRPQTSRGSGE